MAVIPIIRTHPRRGWYRARFHDLPDFTLLVPICFTGHFTFGQLASWPDSGKWQQLTYVPAPRPHRIEPRMGL